jgi:hypothetical protein
MGRRTGRPDDFGYRFKGDSLILYSINCLRMVDGFCDSERLGERLISLVRVHR